MRSNIQTLQFIKRLRISIEHYYLSLESNLHRNRFSYNKLGILIGRNKSYIKYKRAICRENPEYCFSKEDLLNMKKNLKKNHCLTQKITNLFNQYEKTNFIRKINHKIYHYHPDFKMDYFEYIDTKEKAYFLGLIYADGTINRKSNNQLTFESGFSTKDKVILTKFSEAIGFEKRYIRKKKDIEFWRIIINSKEFCKYLIRHGMIVGRRKTYKMRFPKLQSRELNMAFILGFFDGDGTAGTTRITSANLEFLNQIKKKFNILYEPKYVNSVFRDKNKTYYGHAYIMYLGGNVFNELLDNYADSLKRKRKRFTSYD